MRIIKDGDQGIIKLWGKQTVKPTQYRLMKYLLHETVDGNELLCNNVTGELVLLSEEEAKLIAANEIPYCETLRELVEHRFIVPVDFDEYKAVARVRIVLRKLTPKPKFITHYTILPTTACNARCYYCFEKGTKFETMTEQTANDVVDYIEKNCGGNEVEISWFGGEPTVAHKRISQICKGLHERKIKFTSTMMTNGYLFDEQLVNEAVDLWNINFVRFSFDGSRDNYNKIKNYVSACDDPYERVISAVGMFLKREINTAVRMNFDVDTADDFQNLVTDLIDRYGKDKHLSVFSYPIYGEYANSDGIIKHGSASWLTDTQINLDNMSIAEGIYERSDDFPCLNCAGCMAENAGCIVIAPSGSLSRCSSRFEEGDFVGNIYDGFTDMEKYYSWEEITLSDLCIDCKFLPLCAKHQNCPGFDECYHRYRNKRIANKCIDYVRRKEWLKYGNEQTSL